MPRNQETGCLYCTNATKKSNEHLIPAALGSKEYVRTGVTICEGCNNGALSTLDNELCTKSFLALVASKELGKNLANLWAIDESSDRIFIEAYPVWDIDVFQRFVPFPQIVFTAGRPRFYLDGKDALLHNTTDVISLLTRLAKRQFSKHKADERRSCHFEKVSSSLITTRAEYPPRVLFRKTFKELADNHRDRKKTSSLVFRYLTDPDLQRAMIALDSLESPNKPFKRWDECRPSTLNRVGIDYDVCLAFRALLKISLHLVHHASFENDISCDEYTLVRQLINGKSGMRDKYTVDQGFIAKAQLKPLFDEIPKAHQFLIQNYGGLWTVISSFFNQSIGTCIRFSGVNRDYWQSVLVKVGYGKTPLPTTIEYSSLLRPTENVRGSWVGTREFLPDFPWITKELSLSVEKYIPRGKKRR